MKKLLFRFFAWCIEIKLSKRKDSERLLFLANALYSELQSQGYELKSTDGLSKYEVCFFTCGGVGDKKFRIYNILAGWEIKGDRT